MDTTTTHVRSSRPESDEYASFYATYVNMVPAGDIVEALGAQAAEMQRWGGSLSEANGAQRYAPDKWTVRQVIGHLTDAERVFVYRAMCFARGEQTSLPGFDENAYVTNAAFDDRTLASLLQEWHAVRGATMAFFDGATATELLHRGVANGKGISVRALAWITVGHVAHHRRVLTERYGV